MSQSDDFIARAKGMAKIGELLEQLKDDHLPSLTFQDAIEFGQAVQELVQNHLASLSQPNKLPSPSVAIKKLLRENPGGLTAGEIVEKLKGNIDTESGEPSNVIYALLKKMRTSSKIKKTAENKYVIEETTEE